MKKLLVVAIAVCMVLGVVGMASATDYSVSGYFLVRGIYWDTNNLTKDFNTSQALWWQKMRFQVKAEPAEGVGILTRGDIYDGHVWGTNAGVGAIAFDYAYGWFNTPFGYFQIGKMAGGTFGLTWADEWRRADRIMYRNVFGNLTVMAFVEKRVETDWLTNQADADTDHYYVPVIYKMDGGEVGGLFFYNRSAVNSAAGQKTNSILTAAYVKKAFGPLYVEAEVNKWFGSAIEWEDGIAAPDVDVSGLAFYVNVKYSMGPAYVGAFYGYCEGDDPNTADDNELGPTGNDWDLGLILFGDEDWNVNLAGPGLNMGPEFGNSGAGADDGGKAYGIYAGMTVMEGMSVKAAFVTGSADETAGSALDDDFGKEFDLELTYKINEAVTYNAGFGYLWTGDYWKGNVAAAELEDTYLLHHSLQWNF